MLFIQIYVVLRCVVWTGDGRVFFYNPSSRTSVWERPEDLLGRSDVDKMVSTPPDVLVSQNKDVSKVTAIKRTASEGSDGSGDSDQETEGPAKKMKKDEPGKLNIFCV